MPDPNPPTTAPIEIFRAGTHTAMSGDRITFSDADLAAIAGAYDPACHEAPICVGHPSHDLPAYGWVAGLTSDGGRLSAVPSQIDPAFAELQRAGRFKKISAAFYRPDDPRNPKPGAYYLRHVGFLGAQPPAVMGLRQAHFAAADAGALVFGDMDDGAVVRLLRRLRDFVLEKFGADEAERALPADTLNDLSDQAAQPDAPDPLYAPDPLSDPGDTMPAFAEEQRKLDAEAAKIAADKKAFEAEQAKHAADTARHAAEVAAFAEARATERRAADVTLLDGLIKQGRLLPKDRARTLAFLETLAAAKPLTFAEGTATRTADAAEEFRQFLRGQPVKIAFGEVAPSVADELPDARTLTSDHAATRAVIDRADELVAKAKAAGRDLNFTEAAQQAAAEFRSAA